MKNLKKLSTEMGKFIFLKNGVESSVAPQKDDAKPKNIVEAAKMYSGVKDDLTRTPNDEKLKKKLATTKIILDNFIEVSLKKFGCVSDSNKAVKAVRDNISEHPDADSINKSIKDISEKFKGENCKVEDGGSVGTKIKDIKLGNGEKNGVDNKNEKSKKNVAGKEEKEKKESVMSSATIEFSLGEKGKADGVPVLSKDGKFINGEKITGIPKGHVINSITVGDDGKISIKTKILKKGDKFSGKIKFNGKVVNLKDGGVQLKKKVEKSKGMKDLSVYERKVGEIESAMGNMTFNEGAREQYSEYLDETIKSLDKKLEENPEEFSKFKDLIKTFKKLKDRIKNLKVEEKPEDTTNFSSMNDDNKEKYFTSVRSEKKRAEALKNILKPKDKGGFGLEKNSEEYKKLEKRFNTQIDKTREEEEKAFLENITTKESAELAMQQIGYKKGTDKYKKFKKVLDKKVADLDKAAKKGLSETGTEESEEKEKAKKVKKHKTDIADVKKQMDEIKDKSSTEYKKLKAKHKTLTDELTKLESKESLDEKGKEFSDKIDKILKRQTELVKLRKKKKPSKADQQKIKDLEKKSKDDLKGFGESGLDEKDIPQEWKDEKMPPEEKKLLESKKEADLKKLTEARLKRGLEMIKGKKPEEVLALLEQNQDTLTDTFLEKQKDGSMKVNFHGVDENLIGMGHFEKNLMSKFQYVKVFNPKTGQTVIGVRGAGKGNKPGYFDINTGKYIPIFSGSVIKGLKAADISKMSVSVKNAMGHSRNKVVSLTDYLKASKTQRKAYKGQVERNGVRATASLEDLKFEPGVQGLLNTIASAEGTGNNYDARFGSGKGHNPRLSTMTLNQVLNYQRTRRVSSACGRYQFMRKTLLGLKRKLGLSGNETFNKSLQDKLAIQLLKRRGLDKFKSGRMSAGRFQSNLAHEWASLPVNAGGRTAYAGDGLNMTRATRGRHYQLGQNLLSIKGGGK